MIKYLTRMVYVMGLKVGKVSLDSYNPLWEKEFLKEKKNLLKLMQEISISIEHIGSTSIKGLSAKPIIDIAVGIKELSDFEKVKERFLEHSDYSLKEDSASDEILIRKGAEDNRTHFIHVMEIDSQRFKKTLLFRDYLRNHNEDTLKYELLKKDLAKKYSDNRKMYTSSKNDFITEILKKAANNKN